MNNFLFQPAAAFQQRLPTYTYVPGVTPHPFSHPQGHREGGMESTGTLPQIWLRGCVLFTAGYYWEAHEVWESGWHAAGRSGSVADCFKGLIKLAAAGVKSLERNPVGVARHAARSGELFRLVRASEKPLEALPLSAADLQRLQERAVEVQQQRPLANMDQQQAAIHGGVPILGGLPIAALRAPVPRSDPERSEL
ncbi:DUF309 domain-containing protein [Planctomicrobium sp. SH664]|uniref:DUF309 domain-containing protein n=1 Tax=Planctomicrobium sp. SH664 TaxID=3448125 RepID=UPI003F5BC1A4